MSFYRGLNMMSRGVMLDRFVEKEEPVSARGRKALMMGVSLILWTVIAAVGYLVVTQIFFT